MSPEEGRSKGPRLFVGIGASAGGLEACKRMVSGLPEDEGIVYVLVMHLDPSQHSHIAEFLQRLTDLPVQQIGGETPAEPDNVYVIAPNMSLAIHDGVLIPGEPQEPHFRSRPIDGFFTSLAEDQKGRAAGIVLSGTGDDGAGGLKQIRDAGGLCLAQDLESAGYHGMPQSAVDTGAAEAAVPPEQMGEILRRYVGPGQERPQPAGQWRPSRKDYSPGFDGIIELLGERYGVDFSVYKIGTLERRTRRRMEQRQIREWDGYQEYLQEHPDEVAALFSDVLIDVTRFFRDPDSWDYLEREVVPVLLDQHDRDTPVRLWSAGCASGEEAYSLAMVFTEAIEKRGLRCGLQVFGSDLSEQTLMTARRGVYPATTMEQVSPERLHRFFKRVDDHYQVVRSLRDKVTFAVHNLLSDPPFGNIDLVCCRNVMIYLQPEAQEQLLEFFNFALKPKGMLWLGTAEAAARRQDLFRTFSSEHQMLQVLQRGQPRYHVPRWTAARGKQSRGPVPVPRERPRRDVGRSVEQFMVQRHVLPGVAINRNLEIVYFFGTINEYLRQPRGEAHMDLLSWVRPGLYTKLRTGLLQAIDNTTTVSVESLRVDTEEGTRLVDAIIEPVDVPGVEGLFVVVFHERRSILKGEPTERLPGRPEEAEVRNLQRELQDTRQELQGAVEQLDTANEEYRASHEELLSLNEELQSRNEELEMSKEELQSMNEELTTVNSQIETRNAELREISSDLNNLLVSVDQPVLFLDRHLHIRRFTPACKEIMRIVETDVGRHISDIKMEVQDDYLAADAGNVLEALRPQEAEVSAPDGRTFVRRIMPYRDDEDRISGVAVAAFEVTARKRAEEAVRLSEERYRALVTAGTYAVYRMSPDWQEMRELSGRGFLADTTEPTLDWLPKYIPPEDHDRVRAACDKALQEKGIFEVEHRVRRTDDTIGWALSRAVPLLDEQDEIREWFGAARDITERKEAEEKLRQSEQQLSAILEQIPNGVGVVDRTGRFILLNRIMRGYVDSLLPSRDAEQAQRWRATDREGRALPVEDWPGARALRGEWLAEGQEFIFTDEAGEEHWVLVSAAPFEWEQALIGAIVTVRDISERMRMEKELESHREALERVVQDRTSELSARTEELLQAQKMEAVGRLAGGIAHDFNNLMQIVIGWTNRVLRRIRDEDPSRAGIQAVNQAGQKAAQLTQKLLAFSRKQVLQLEQLDLVDIVRDMMPLVSRLIGEGIRMRFEPPSVPLRVEADANQIEQVIMNLCVNARDAMPRGGTLTIRLRRAPHDASAIAGRAGPFAELAVADTGHGIDQETMSHVFEPFFTTKSAEEGTGLGLSTTYGIVKQSGGEITVESQVGEGTCFRIFLPLLQRPEQEPEGKAAVEEETPQLQGTLLLVENDEKVRQLLTVELRDLGLKVMSATGIDEAVEVAETHQGRLDVLITDMVLEGADGRMVAEGVRKRHPEVQIIYMSGYSRLNVEQNLEGLPGDYVQKPISSALLAQKLQKLLEEQE